MAKKNEKAMEPLTICGQLEKIAEDMCTGYCKYPYMPLPAGKTEDWLSEDPDSPCNTCPLMRLT